LAGAEFGFLAAGAAAGAGGESVDGAFGHEGVLELGDGVEDLEEHAAEGGGGVDALVEDDQVDTAVLQGLVELGAASECARGLVEEDFVAASCGECVVLALGVLTAGGHSAVPDAHAADGIASGGGRGEGADIVGLSNEKCARECMARGRDRRGRLGQGLTLSWGCP